MRLRRCGSTEGAWYRRNPQNHSGVAAVQQHSRLAVVLLSREQVHRFQVSGQSHTIIGSTTCPLLHQREFVTCSVLLEGKFLELHVQFFKRLAQLHHLSTRHWLMRQLSAVHAKSMAFGATTQDLHSEPLCETSTVETVATARQRRPERVHGK